MFIKNLKFMILKNKAFKKVLNLNNEKLISVKELKNGTDSKVFLLNDKYIIKFHSRHVIMGESKYFNINKNSKNEEVVYCDKFYRYIVYKYIKNEDKNFDVKSLIPEIKDYIDNYSLYEDRGYGYLFEEKKSWRTFLETETNDKKEFALKVLKESDCRKVDKAFDVIEKYNFEKKLLHGDFGIHNMLFKDSKLVGIIDPQPLIGDVIYDYLFFLFSTSKITKQIDILSIYKFFPNEPKEKVDAMLMIVLFNRIARCVKHKLKDLDFFIDLWRKIIKN